MRVTQQVNPDNGQPRYIYTHTAPEWLLGNALEAGVYAVCAALTVKETVSALRQVNARTPQHDQASSAAPETAQTLLASQYAPLRGAGMLLAATAQVVRETRLPK